MILSEYEDLLQRTLYMHQDEGLHFLGFTHEPLENPVHRACKRALDLAVALPAALLLLPPLTLVVSLLHRRQSPGPLFHRQMRAGIQNRTFSIWKFRTMHPDHGQENQAATADDPRIFPAGRWLRRLSLDELPQLLNVLRGEMSLVGPRPVCPNTTASSPNCSPVITSAPSSNPA